MVAESNGCPPMPQNSIRLNNSGTTPSGATWPTSFPTMPNTCDKLHNNRSVNNVPIPADFTPVSKPPNSNDRYSITYVGLNKEQSAWSGTLVKK